MDHDPLTSKDIITANKYIINLEKNEKNIWIKVNFDKNGTQSSFRIKISDFSKIDSYFNGINNKISAIYNYLLLVFNKNTFEIEKDQNNDDILIIKIDCLKENKKENIILKLKSYNDLIIDEDDEKTNNYDNNNFLNEINNFNSDSINCIAAPIITDKTKIKNPNDKNEYFYYKKNDKDNEYNIYFYKSEVKKNLYKEIIFKIIEKKESGDKVYYSYLNLVKFFEISESYFNKFHYSIEEIYDNLLLIFFNHNYIISKFKKFLRVSLSYINSIGIHKNFISKLNFFAFTNSENKRNINEIVDKYNIQLIKYIKKFGDNVEDKKFKNIIKLPENYKNEASKKGMEIKNIEINCLDINNVIENIIKKQNNINIIEKKDISLPKDNSIKSNNNNLIIINNKEVVGKYFKEFEKLNKNENNINENIVKKIKKEEKDFNLRKDNEIISENKKKEKNSNYQKDNEIISENKNEIKIINYQKDNEIKSENKYQEKEIFKFYDIMEPKSAIKFICEKNDNSMKSEININKEIISHENESIINLEEQKQEQEKEKNNKEIKKENISHSSNYVNPISLPKNDSKINSLQKKEKIYKNKYDSNPFFLNRKRNKYINGKKTNIECLVNSFMKTIISKRKRLFNNTSLLTDRQLLFLLRKIEKSNPEFRYLNIQIHSDIIFDYNIKDSLNNNATFESNIISDFYKKVKNKKNLIFLIKTKNNKSFGGFSPSGFDPNNKINDNDSFVFSVDKMRIYDFFGKNEKCVLGYNNKLPEFKNQIFFEDNNIRVGYTGNKKDSFLIEEDYELNDGVKMFYINKIQVISVYVLNL